MPPKQHFLLLDGLRGIAAIIVMFYHVSQTHGVFMPRFAPLAVDFFFMLSGFVVAYAYEEKLGSARLTPRRFIAIRMIRLYPMILLGMGMGLAISAARMVTVGDIAPAQFVSLSISSLLVLPSWALPQYPTAFPANMALWSLFFELAINVVYAFIARALSDRILTIVTILAGLALIAATVANGSIAMGMNKHGFLGGFTRVTFAFFAGVYLFRHWRARRGTTPANPTAAWILGGAFTILLLVPLSIAYPVDLALVLFVFPALIVGASRIAVEGWSARLCRWLGALSYPLYAVHAPILRAIDVGFAHAPTLRDHGWLPIAIQMTAGLVGGIAALRLYDDPVRSLLSRRLLKHG